ncbi:hypothetical protein PFISCL1PPCAC_917, partial [Pristionchus fissidentatus]
FEVVMRLQLLSTALLLLAGCGVRAQDNTLTAIKLESDVLKGYNKKHRPVKSDKTAVGVTILISITHIEKVSEDEQTAIIHGIMYSSWKDEYLNWDPSKYNGTSIMYLDTWKIWQPALSLYNSARGNQWNLYMGGSPASIASDGTVSSHGSFSFHVTCQFDFSSWPNDEHRCPIVIADWVYDLSRVNLSESISDVDMRPYVTLHYDPFEEREKKHVAGWEIVSTTRKHCYWGRKWCQDEVNIAPGSDDKYEYYWSVLEYAVMIRRHAPYIVYTLVIPTLLSSSLTLFAFWIDHDFYPLLLLVFNAIFQGLYGWDMIRALPTGNGTMPDMVFFYGLNLCLTVLAIIFHVLIEVIPINLPDKLEMPETVREFATQLRHVNFFGTKGLSFDPEELYGNGGVVDGVPTSTTTIAPSVLSSSSSSALLAGFETTPEAGEILVQMGEEKPSCSKVEDEAPTVEVSNHVSGDSVIEVEKKEGEEAELPPSTPADYVQIARRIAFALYALAYLWELPRAFF